MPGQRITSAADRLTLAKFPEKARGRVLRLRPAPSRVHRNWSISIAATEPQPKRYAG
jgi:hypothetical protein